MVKTPTEMTFEIKIYFPINPIQPPLNDEDQGPERKHASVNKHTSLFSHYHANPLNHRVNLMQTCKKLNWSKERDGIGKHASGSRVRLLPYFA